MSVIFGLQDSRVPFIKGITEVRSSDSWNDADKIPLDWRECDLHQTSSTPQRRQTKRSGRENTKPVGTLSPDISSIGEPYEWDQNHVGTLLSSSPPTISFSPPSPGSGALNGSIVPQDMPSVIKALDLRMNGGGAELKEAPTATEPEKRPNLSVHQFHIERILSSPNKNKSLDSPPDEATTNLSDPASWGNSALIIQRMEYLLSLINQNYISLPSFPRLFPQQHSMKPTANHTVKKDSAVIEHGRSYSSSLEQISAKTPDISRTKSRNLAQCEPETNLSNQDENAGKGTVLFYYPEPSDSKEQVRAMLERNDPRLKYVNDGAAIKNPFAVDRRVQLEHLMKMLCVQTPTGEYVCKGCDRRTSQLRPMQQHLLSHSASKFHLCVRCLKGFNDKYDMKRHTRKHTHIRPYICPECSRSFSQRCSLEGHRKKIHRVRLNYSRNQRREVMRVCENCGFTCDSFNQMFQHVLLKHPSSSCLARLEKQLRSKEAHHARQTNSGSSLQQLNRMATGREEFIPVIQ